MSGAGAVAVGPHPPAAPGRHAEVAGLRDLWRACPPELAARHGVAAMDVGDGVCLACAALPGRPMFNHAIGIGIGTPAGDAELDAVERFYGDMGTGYVVAVAPQARGLEERLRARGFADDRPWITFHRPAGPIEGPDGDVRTVDAAAAGPAGADAFGAIVTTAFGVPEALAPWLAAVVGRPGWVCRLAMLGDEPVGAAALHVAGDAAWFALGATLPGRRGLGAQGRLFASRARRALELGARHFVTETGAPRDGEGPGPSHRNMLRAGFAEVGLRPNLASPPGRP